MSKTKQLPDLAPAINNFKARMDELALECDMEIFELHRGEDPFWDFLWDHEKSVTAVIGIVGAVAPIMGLIAWHLSRGGMLSL